MDERSCLHFARLEQEAYPVVTEATARYRLDDLGGDALHDWGGVLVDFLELV